MSFIEQLSGISPDGGSGFIEAIIFTLLGSVLVALAWLRAPKQRIRNPPTG